MMKRHDCYYNLKDHLNLDFTRKLPHNSHYLFLIIRILMIIFLYIYCKCITSINTKLDFQTLYGTVVNNKNKSDNPIINPIIKGLHRDLSV